MKEKKATITAKGASVKLWTDLILELNLICKAWKPYAKLELNAPSINKIISHSTKKYDTKYHLKKD